MAAAEVEEVAEVFAEVVAVEAAPPVATLIKPADPSLPPGRVRSMFKKLDANGDKVVTLAELQAGFEEEFAARSGGGLAAHAKARIPEIFDEHATDDEARGKVLKIGIFSRFYAEVLFSHFDTSNNGSLQMDEAQRALKFLLKPDEAANEIAIAYPCDPDGEMKLPFSWFWVNYQAME